MEPRRKLLSILLAGLLLFANTACACASAAENVADIDVHSHHLQDDAAQAGKTLCPHQACEDCESLAVMVATERDGNLASFAKLGFADDVIWTEVTETEISLAAPLVVQASPPLKKTLRRAETPVLRADLLLQ